LQAILAVCNIILYHFNHDHLQAIDFGFGSSQLGLSEIEKSKNYTTGVQYAPVLPPPPIPLGIGRSSTTASSTAASQDDGCRQQSGSRTKPDKLLLAQRVDAFQPLKFGTWHA
jgi:hypothetical protein